MYLVASPAAGIAGKKIKALDRRDDGFCKTPKRDLPAISTVLTTSIERVGDSIVDYIRANIHIAPIYYLVAVLIGIVLTGTSKRWYVSILIPYMFLVFAVTVLSRRAGATAQYQLRLFWSYGESFEGQKNQILANVLMFVPIGASLAFEKKKWSVVYGIAFSALIEVTQLITHRGLFEFDDIFHNTIGLLIGFCLTLGLIRSIKLIRQRKQREKFDHIR